MLFSQKSNVERRLGTFYLGIVVLIFSVSVETHADDPVFREESETANACCAFDEDCNLTTRSCSDYAPGACNGGSAYRIVAADNRKVCTQNIFGAAGVTCYEAVDKIPCAFNTLCIFDESLGRCIDSTDVPVEVPRTCRPDCPVQ